MSRRVLPSRHLMLGCGRILVLTVIAGVAHGFFQSSHAELVTQPQKLLQPVEIHVEPEPVKIASSGETPHPTFKQQVASEQSPIAPSQDSGSFYPSRAGSVLINILADQTPLEDVLQEFGNQMNIRVFCSPGVRGKVSGRFFGMTPQKFLDQLSRAYGLDWLFYNQQIYFSSSAESETIVRTLRYLPGDQAVKVVRQMGIVGVGASIRGIPGTPLVMLTGPPRFLEMAQEVLRTLEAQSAYKQNERVIQVFPINYAWAYDVQLVGGGLYGGGGGGGYGGGGVGPGIVQGVATLLSQLVAGGSGGSGISMGNFVPTSKPVASVFDQAGNQQRVARAFPPDQQPPSSNNSPKNVTTAGPGNNAWNAGRQNEQDAGSGNVSIVADVRSNSVIIRDVRENMPFYKAAIAKLDVPVRVVEISASIVDADVNSGRILGMSGINIAPLGPLASFQASSSALGANSGNVSLSGIYGTSSITAALNFLETNNRAKTLSRPTLVTLDNYAASIADTHTVYVRVQGGRDTPGNLFGISSGLTLQVVPHITMERGQPQVSLQIVITEGKNGRDQQGNDTTKKTTLFTQAVVRMDQSLLIGGLYRKISSKERSGYPWLSSIPIVNFFFSTHSRNKGVVERLILITPRVVDLYSKNLGDYSRYFRPSPTVEEAEQTAREAQMPASMVPVNKKKKKSSD